jgi:hypothetical protein
VKCNRLEVLLLFSNSLLWLERERERESETDRVGVVRWLQG